MLKKVFVICFSGNQGGMELDAIRMSRRVAQYASVKLIGMSGSPIEVMALDDSNQGYSYSFIGCNLNRFLARGLVDPRIVRVIRAEVKTENPDLLIFFGTSEVKSIGLSLIGLNVKLALRVGTTINRPKTSWFQRLAYSRVDAFLAISEHIKSNILDSFPIALSRPIKVCFPVIELGSRQKNIEAHVKPSLSVVYHSRFVRGKGQLDALIAFRAVTMSNINLKLILIGAFEDEAYVNEINSYIEKYSLGEQVQVLPNSDDVISVVESSQIFLGPSYGEGFSNSFAEALSLGLICITYDNTVFPYFKDLGFEFFLSPTGDVIQLEEALSQAITAHTDCSINTAKNIALAEQLFSSKSEKNVLQATYQSLMH